MNKLLAYLLFITTIFMGFGAISFPANAHGLATTKNQLINNYFVEFEYDTLGDVTAEQLTTYGFELLKPDNTEESIDFDRVFVKFAKQGDGAILSGNIFPMEGYGRKTARINATFEEEGTYEVVMTYYKTDKQLAEATFDFKVGPSDTPKTENKKGLDAIPYLWAISLVVGFIGGTLIHITVKNEPKTKTK